MLHWDPRVPLETVLDYLAAGETVDGILESFRSLRREHVTGVLLWQRDQARLAAGLKTRAS